MSSTLEKKLSSARIALQNMGSALDPDLYSASIALAIAMIMGAFFRSNFLAVCVVAAIIGTFGSNLLAVCQAIFPSWALKGQSVIATLFLKIKGGRTAELKDIEGLINDANKLKIDLDTMGGGGIFHKANESAAQAKAIVGNISQISKYIEEIQGKANTPALCLLCNGIAKHAPVIGVAFVALQPVLLKFVEAKKTDDLVVETSNRITELLEEVKSTIRQTRKYKVDLTPAEVSDIHSLILIIEDGLKLVGKVMGERESKIRRFLRAGNHGGLLKGWLDMTENFLKTDERKKGALAYIRIWHMVETQRKYFAFLAFTSVVNTTILLAVAYGVFFVIIPMLNKDCLSVVVFKWVTEKGKNWLGRVEKEDLYALGALLRAIGVVR